MTINHSFYLVYERRRAGEWCVSIIGEGVTNAFPFAAFCSGNKTNSRIADHRIAILTVFVLQFSLRVRKGG